MTRSSLPRTVAVAGRRVALAAGVVLCACACPPATPPPAPAAPVALAPLPAPSSRGAADAPNPASALPAIPLDAFRDGAQHYRKRLDHDYPRHPPEALREIADNMLLYQRQNGGWPPNWDPQLVLSEQDRQRLLEQRSLADTSLDNRATYPVIEYLAEAHQRTGDARYRDAALAGLEFLLRAQHSSGGFPHSFPSEQGYRRHITLMDEVFSGTLSTLRRVSRPGPPFDFVSAELRARVTQALRRGDACLLRLQVMVRGQPTVWAGQYDRETLEPTTAREYELPSLVSSESVDVVRYLMSIEPPSAEVVRAVDAAIAWFERSKITGLRVEEFPIEPVRFPYHTATTDRRVVADPTAPALWARFYEIDGNRPFMANRDGRKVYSLAEVELERRTGYRWYGEFARELLSSDYPAWRARVTMAGSAAAD